MDTTIEPKLDPLAGVLDENGAPVEQNLRIAAALLGPGYKGRRAQVPADERAHAATRLLTIWQRTDFGPPPAYLREAVEGEPTEWHDRRAKLLEIGEFADKRLSVAQPDVQRLAANFDLPVPVLIEHVENPLRLGYLTQVEALGPELFGTLALTPGGEKVIEDSRAKALSLSVSRDLDRIYEVSVVANPRIASARLFCEDFRTDASVSQSFWMKEAGRLREELERKRVDEIIARLSKNGSLAPACVEVATKTFHAARNAGCEEAFVEFLEALPKTVHFGELVPGDRAPQTNLPPEEAAFYAHHFPGLDLNEIAKRKVK